jgi:lysine-N-methylase
VVAANRISRKALKSKLLDAFVCVGPACADHCCNTWTVKVDAPTLALYQASAPQLLEVVEQREGLGAVLAFDRSTGLCPQLDCGSCRIHSTYGTDFLTDTCHLYPRITREIGSATVMTAALSCPEITRLALYQQAPLTLTEAVIDRVPEAIKNYGAEGVDEAAALALIAALQVDTLSPAQHLRMLATEAYVFSNAPMAQWPTLHVALQPSLPAALPAPVTHPHDALFMLIVLTTLVTACKVTPSTRLLEVVALMEQALNIKLLWDQATANTQPDTFSRLQALELRAAQHYQPVLQPLLHAVLNAQLSASLYPYAGLGNSPSERITWIAYGYALTRLALVCAVDQSGGKLPESLGIQVVQSLARVLDHVGTLETAMPMLKEIGWLDPARLAGLLTPHQM